MDNELPDAPEDDRFACTVCGLIGFIISFLGALFSFIIAGESYIYKEYLLILGFAMLFGSLVIFCCLLHESKRIFSAESQPSELIMLQRRGFHTPEGPTNYQAIQSESDTEPHLELSIQHEPVEESHLYERSRDSGEIANSENDSDPESQALLKTVKSGLQTGSKQKSIESEDDRSGPSNVSGKSSEGTESKLEDSSSEAMSALSLSDSSKSPTRSVVKETEV